MIAGVDFFCQIENGIVKNWEDMEHLWNYTFYEKLQVLTHSLIMHFSLSVSHTVTTAMTSAGLGAHSLLWSSCVYCVYVVLCWVADS